MPDIPATREHPLSRGDRDAIVSLRVESVLALPLFTLIRVGLRPPSGRIQGGIFYRITDGLGPVLRDYTARDVLWAQAGSWVQHKWPWGFDVLATPESPSATFTGEGRMLRFVCHDIRRLSPAGLRWLYDWMGDTFDLRNR